MGSSNPVSTLSLLVLRGPFLHQEPKGEKSVGSVV
jgi:hypothetical protein